jgi:hypothetical protein
MGRAVPSLLLGLAPGGGCLAARVTTGAGGLLHHLFTFAEAAIPPQPSAFLWPFSSGSSRPRLGVTQHRALWSPDFPQPAQRTHVRAAGRDRLADSGVDSIIAHGQRLSRVEPNSKCYSDGL